MKIGDFVTGYGSGYWQLIDIKPHIATEDYDSEVDLYNQCGTIRRILIASINTAKENTT